MRQNKTVLIVTYYWPPSGGGGVQRWLKFAKYLPGYGWNVFVYTPENPHFKIKDPSLNKDVPDNIIVYKKPIWEPYRLGKLFNKNIGNTQVQKATERKSYSSLIANWIRGNLLFPDPRVFWVKPSVSFLSGKIPKLDVDVIITTGPPHSMHLIGLKLKMKYPDIKWVADFRDPFAKMDILDNFHLSKWAKEKYLALEKKILTNCDIVLSTSFSLPKVLVKFDLDKYHVITNGFDKEDIQLRKEIKQENNIESKLHIGYAGQMQDSRNPVGLWEALEQLVINRIFSVSQIRFFVAGNISPKILNYIKHHSILSQIVEFKGYLKHDQLEELLNDCNVLLLLNNQTINGKVCIPGKLFEYLVYGKAILALGYPDSDTSRILNELYDYGCIAYDDVVTIQSFLKNVPYVSDINEERIDKYSRKYLTAILSKLLDKNIGVNSN